ncbi:TIGR02677 family protein [Actinopolymorpha alba]|uniref:TIGR02677 family protein n=1 Tax=Actinopolymorpha alba TaxID=533267 RepID=UPI00037030AE|nr:TIGR02677 family protein [Actinopolymorpha alba]
MSAYRRLPRNIFAFTTTDLAELHTATLQAFGDAHERLETALTFDDVRSHLRAMGWYAHLSDAELSSTLRSLTQWGLLDVVQNHAAHYASAEEYERKNLQYSLTKAGEAAFEGVQRALTVLASTGALQTAVLEAISDRLDELHGYQLDERSSDRRIFTALTELEGHLDALRSNTKQFNSELQRLIRDDATDLAMFHEVKRATIAYLEEFVTHLDVRKHAIQEALRRVDDHGATALHRRALRGADLPAFGGDDPGPAWLAHRANRWDGLRAWFLPDDEGAPRIEELRDIARRAIISLMRVLERISESRRRSSSTVSDFRALARWFASVPSEDDAHKLWDAAFGLGSARHAHLAPDDVEAVPSSTPWSEVEPVPVSPLLRTRGRNEQVGRTAKVRDIRALRERRRTAARLERAELEAAWNALATNGVVRLSSLGRLDHSAFEHLLDLVGRALAGAADSSGVRRGTSADGRVEITLVAPSDGRTATLRTPRGRFGGPDYHLRIQLTEETGQEARREAARSEAGRESRREARR